MSFPSLKNNPVRYSGETLKCSICKKEMSYIDTNQLWISKLVGTDVLPLLVNLCSKACESKLPDPEENYINHAHKGGPDLVQPPNLTEIWEKEKEQRGSEISEIQIIKPAEKMSILKLIKKIWDR